MLKAEIQNIPEELIYEMVNGIPIYYSRYQEYLSGDKAIGDIMGSSLKQSRIITQLIILFSSKLDEKYCSPVRAKYW
ncbi:MAG: hypothetical protein AAFO07_28985 [Bacteroidota bacterium]